MAKQVTSIRLSKESIDKINALIVLEDPEANLKSNQNKSAVIIKAVDFYYAAKMDDAVGDEYLQRMATYINDAIKQNLNAIARSCNATRFITEVNKELIKILLLTYDLPQESDKALKLLKQPSIYEELISKQMLKALQEGSGDHEN
ncbi:DUF3313 domain-containing protein [Holdemania massiliensis]|uniref:DUF3313 domain-containing protein n=1 Tax=Holdemania massiliensis TaxID=1468449 RepID=UPI001F06B0FB|nr:DUF3313 domain-containing protein [Holdemania massiliensis]MCH1942414.1 DUF3313 domain-containing protein [Holdemania massiliensis]